MNQAFTLSGLVPGSGAIGTGGMIGGVLCGGAVLALLTVLAIRLWRYRDADARAGAEFSLDEFSLEPYEPMNRLLSDEDFEFLARQPGYRPEIGVRLRRDRRRIFRMFLRELAADFRTIHAQARQLASLSSEQNAKSVTLLFAQQWTFWRVMAQIEMKLMMPYTPFPEVDVRALIASVESMRAEMVRLSAAAA